MTHKYIGKLNIIGSDHGLLPGPRKAIFLKQSWNIVNKLSEILSEIHSFFIQENAFENVCEMTAFCLRLNVLNNRQPSFS